MIMLSHASVLEGFHKSSHTFSLHKGVAIIQYFVRFIIKQRTQFLFGMHWSDITYFYFLIITVKAWGLCYVCNYRHFKLSGLRGVPYKYSKMTGLELASGNLNTVCVEDPTSVMLLFTQRSQQLLDDKVPYKRLIFSRCKYTTIHKL